MQGFMIALRAIHYAAVIALFGEFVFLFYVASPAMRAMRRAHRDELPEPRRRLFRLALWWVSAEMVTGLLWLVAQAAAMSGLSLVEALNRETLGDVLFQTQFGQVWMFRFGLSVALAALLLAGRRKALKRESAILGGCALLAGILLASLAWTGHANAARGADRPIHLSADVIHLLAAGAWLGGLIPLARLFARARHAGTARALNISAEAAQRFSVLGMTSVGALVVTGIANTWYTVGAVPALFGTDYGRLLLFKLSLFAGMLALAASNRVRLTPRLAKSAQAAQRAIALARLQRNAIGEALLGLAVVAVVGALGVMTPALHEKIVWPFPYTLEWDAKPLLVPAHPSTYAHSPVGYTITSIARGARLYERHCAGCHGSSGYTDGSGAVGLAVAPDDLAAHFLDRREGDVFWQLQHGIPGTTMPGFGDRIDEAGLWDLIEFLHARADAQGADPITAQVDTRRSIVPPDFTFQVAAHAQESLAAMRGSRMVLLVLYTLPASRERLRALGASASELHHAGVRIIAFPMNPVALMEKDEMIDPSLLADPVPNLVAAYGMHGRLRGANSHRLEHQEFLIDRQGNLRARWAPGDEPAWDRTGELLRQVDLLVRANPASPMPKEHAH